MTDSAPPRALSGITVLELGQVYNGPYAGSLLRSLGADVIKVEPRHGELIRGRAGNSDSSSAFNLINGGKRGITLDLKQEEGRALLLQLVRRADVLIENFAPGVMERLQLSYAQLAEVNPRLIVGSGKGYGSTGPNSGLRGMDITVQAMSGIVSTTGFPEQDPVKAGPAVVDFNAGVHLAAAILAALYHRERTGRGQLVEISMQDAIIPSLTSNIAGYLDNHGDFPERTGNRHGGLSIAPYNIYPAADGWVGILCVRERHWQSLCRLMCRQDLADDPRLSTQTGRVERIDEVDKAVGEWTETALKEELVVLMQQADIPCAPVRNLAEVIRDPHLRNRGMLTEVQRDGLSYTVFGSPLRLMDSPPMPATAPPRLGEHNAEVLTEILGLAERDITTLVDRQIV